MGSRAARVTRGMLASGVAVFVAALFHVAGGGAAPGPVAVALSLAFATLASIALTARRLSLWRLSAAVVVSQLLFHLLFGLGSGSATFVPAGGSAPGGLSAHLHAGQHLTMIAGMPSAHGQAGDQAAMWLSHLAAALLTIVALRHGERAFWGLFETARIGVSRLLARAAAAPVPLPGSRPVVLATGPAPLLDLGLPLARLRHRGPPAAAGAH